MLLFFEPHQMAGDSAEASDGTKASNGANAHPGDGTKAKVADSDKTGDSA